MRRLEGHVCVVTGAAGASRRAAANRLGAEGAMVEGIDLLEHGVGNLALQTDLTDEAAVQEALDRLR